MRRSLTLAATIAFVASFAAAGMADAAPCKDAKGKFMKCPTPAASPGRCRDKTSKAFAKCGAPNTEPVPMAAAKSAPATAAKPTAMAAAKPAPAAAAKPAAKAPAKK